MDKVRTDIDINYWKKTIKDVLEMWKKLQGKDPNGKSNCNFIFYTEKVIENGGAVCFPINVDFNGKVSSETLKKFLRTINLELLDTISDFYGLSTDYFIKVTLDNERRRKEEELKARFKKYNQKEAMIIGGLVILCIFILYILWSL